MRETETRFVEIMGISISILLLFAFYYNRKVRRKMNNLLRQSKLFVKRNSSTILTCIGGVGVVATSVMAVKATPKAIRLIEQAEEEKGDKLTKTEKVVVAGPAYIPAAVTGVATIACIFGANALNKKHQASLMSAYALLDSSYKDYKNKVGELYGEEADEHVRDELAKDKYEDEDVQVGNGKQLFYDEFSGRYFESTMADVLRAEYEVNRRLSQFAGLYLNDWYDLLDIPRVDYGDYMGWSSSELYDATWESWLDFDHKKVTMDDGLECFIISISFDPTFGFEDY